MFGAKIRGPRQSQKFSRMPTYQFDDDDESVSSSSSEDEVSQSKSKNEPAAGGDVDEIRNARQRRKAEDSGPYSKFSVGNDFFRTRGNVSARDGRLRISVKEAARSDFLVKTLGAGIRHRLFPAPHNKTQSVSAESETETASGDRIFEDPATRPKLNIVIIVIGSRGDIQPFLEIGRVLKGEYGHRVRIATHPAFKDFVEKDSGLEFFPVGGDPSELMAFMVKNPGLIPSMETVRAGEIGRRRAAMYEMFQGMWRACVNITDDKAGAKNSEPGEEDGAPFIADAIIANPPSFAHIHIAERLGVPLHVMFTFPYSPTTQFPHPLANIKQSNVENAYTNFLSYPLVEMMTWQGLGDLVNKFRVKFLGLDPVSTLWAPGQLYRLEVPHTYLWSPSLVPKPHDWGPEIDVAGFVFLDLGSSFEPPTELTKFLGAGPPPVYIGFGSIVVDDPDRFTQLIFSAVKQAGVRALVSKGWGGIGGEGLEIPENIFLLDNTPHDWLFPRVSAVVHHGGAGTTAIGLKCGKPTMIVPFFGDQPFWGDMVAQARAGAFKCIPYKKLTVEKLANGIKECLTDEVKENVKSIAENIAKEGNGATNAVRSFHRSLPLRGDQSMRCSILQERVAVWRLKGTQQRFSALAAELLVRKEKIRWKDLVLCRHMEWNDFEGPGEPFTGASMVAVRTARDFGKGISSVPVRLAKVTKKREEHDERKKRRMEKLEQMRQQDTSKNDSGQKNGAIHGVGGDQIHDNSASNAPAEEEVERPYNTSDPSETSEGEEDQDKGYGSRESTPSDENRAEPTRQDTELSVISADPSQTLAGELAHQTGSGLKVSGKAIIKAPMELQLAIAQGFHNAPRLYGDETVRRPRRITGFKSGLRAGRDEFIYGHADAFTGLYKLPKLGYQQNGALGCLEGFGMSVGGLVLKPISATAAPFPFAMKGIEREWNARHGGPGTSQWMKRARQIQGGQELVKLQLDHKRRHDQSEKEASPSEEQPESRDDLKKLEARVDHAWAVLAELFDMKEQAKERGCLMRLRFQREKKKWRDTHALESIASAEEALNARKKGIPVEQAMHDHKAEVKKAKKMPRKPGMEPSPGSAKIDDVEHANGETGRAKEKEKRAQASGTSSKERTAKRTRDRNATNATDFAFSAISGAVR